MKDYEAFDALGLAELVRRREVSPLELLGAAEERLEEERNAELNAVVLRLAAEARAAIAAGLPEGPFSGVPFLLKDLGIQMAGTPTSEGSRFFHGRIAEHDSELLVRYRRAGLVIFGKTATPELGLTTTTESQLFGATRNPWNRARSTGGSSGGAAAAVAAGIVPAAHASDGGGSIRIPAACCGLFGLKPTRARTPLAPGSGEGWAGMGCWHAITRSVRDSAALLDASAGPALGDPYFAPPPARPFLAEVGAPVGRLRIALAVDAFNGAPTHPHCRAAAEDAARLCESLGHEVVPERPSLDAEQLRLAAGAIVCAHTQAAVAARAAELGRSFGDADLEPVTRATVRSGERCSALDYVRAVQVLHSTGRALAGFFERFDALLSPTLAVPPLPLGAASLASSDRATFDAALAASTGFTMLYNAAGVPAMSVPLHWSEEGLPIGVQFAAAFGGEAVLFRLAAQLEQARPWFSRRPV